MHLLFRTSCLFSCLLFVTVVNAQVAPEVQPNANTPVYKLKIKPKAEPSPALRYTLYPEVRTQVNGNAAQGYYRAFSPDWMSYRNDKEYSKKYEKWLSVPLKELDEKEINIPQGMLTQLHDSALKNYCDWDMLAKLRKDGISMLLPDLQGMREFSRALSIDCRVQLKKGEIDKALADIRTGLTLSHHLGEGPTLIQGLVAVAAGTMMFPRIDELISHEKAPNLYWALTTLPQPLVDFRTGLGGEVLMIDNLFPGMRDMLYSGKVTPITQEEMMKVFPLLEQLNVSDNKSSLKQMLVQAALVLNIEAAKKALLEHGITEPMLTNITPLQIIFMAEVLLYDKTYQNMIKWNSIPYPVARKRIKELDATIKKPETSVLSPFPLGTFSAMILPAVSRVMEAGPKMERRIAALRIIEAIRMQAAFDKAWPDSLEKITIVPVPADPFTGGAFAFKKEGKKITITAKVPEGEKPSTNNNFTYELELED
ncbi:MAG: hypothetical protein EBT92_10150 [Planctomycetes bacterium]|nr:hypothetical protein [Planctomycetota bacterium]NBY01923.1 hypothetical protein [Planctomycetota bacterium]